MTLEGTNIVDNFWCDSLNNFHVIKTFQINLSNFFYAEKFNLNYLMSGALLFAAVLKRVDRKGLYFKLSLLK